ncbi:MAG TPA: zinc-binding dehydrogenase [Phycisphaerae bacterium]|nr:zinc-binding dehydrogenase [Phycisphaerae bacterium]
MAGDAVRMSRAAVIPAPNAPVEVREVPLPELEDGAALLRMEFSEVCGTDLHLQQGLLAETPYPLIPGHANVGVIEAVRGAVADVAGRAIECGQRVTFLDVHGTCGACWFCLVAKASTRCPSRKVYGITYGAEEGLLGGWSEYVHLRPGVRIIPLPEGLRAETVIGGGCGLPTAFHAVDRSDIHMAETVLVQGTGPVGLSCIAFARLRGAAAVIAIGAPQRRLDAARRMGADLVLDLDATTAAQRRDAVLAATEGRGADTAIEASGSPAAVPEGLDLVRDGGTYTVVGQYTDHGAVPINPHLQINKKHVDIRGVWGIDYSHLHRAIVMQQRYNDRVGWERLITHRFDLDHANEALEAVRSGEAIKAVICPWGVS